MRVLDPGPIAQSGVSQQRKEHIVGIVLQPCVREKEARYGHFVAARRAGEID